MKSLHVSIALYVLLFLFACSKPPPHDEVLAGKRALEFSEAAFVRRDYAAAYKLLSDKAKAYQSVENFRKAVGGKARSHGRPLRKRLLFRSVPRARIRRDCGVGADGSRSRCFADRLSGISSAVK